MVTTFDPSAGSFKQTLLLFDLSIYGHHATYIQYLIRYWQQQKINHQLIVIVSPQFLIIHQDVVDLAKALSEDNITFISITPKEEAQLSSRSSSIKRNLRHWQEWQLYCYYARQMKATQSLIMYFDTYQMLLGLGQTSPCPFSGIYFRPTFHYKELGNPPKRLKVKIQRQWEYYSLISVLKKSMLRCLFSLDPFAVNYVKKRVPQAKIISLADPVETHFSPTVDSEQFKKMLGIEDHRKVGILFGALTARKGIYPLLKAIKTLTMEQCEQFCLLLVGAADPIERQRIQSEISDLRQSCPVQIVEHYKFVAEEDIPNYFQVSNFVLAPYQQHVGMSGILLLAAAAQKPVLCSEYGLMGKLVSHHQIGITVDSANPEAIAVGLGHLLQVEPEKLCDRSRMAAFAEQNAWENFARTIMSQLKLD